MAFALDTWAAWTTDLARLLYSLHPQLTFHLLGILLKEVFWFSLGTSLTESTIGISASCQVLLYPCGLQLNETAGFFKCVNVLLAIVFIEICHHRALRVGVAGAIVCCFFVVLPPIVLDFSLIYRTLLRARYIVPATWRISRVARLTTRTLADIVFVRTSYLVNFTVVLFELLFDW